MPTTTATDEVRDGARLLARLIEPLTGQVYFAPECHERYQALGFNGSPFATADGVALPDGPAYFTSRGSALGQAPGELVAAAFGVFNAEAVVPAVTFGWTLTDAATIAAARLDGAVAPARAHPRPGARRDRPRQRAPRPRRRPPRAVGPGAVRRHARPGPARHAARRPVPPRRPAPRVPRRQPHRRVGGRRPRRHRDRPAHRALLGHAHPHLRAHPRLERRPARRRRGPPRPTPASWHDGQLTDAGPRPPRGRSSSPPTPRWPPPSTPSAATSRSSTTSSALGHERHGRGRLPPVPAGHHAVARRGRASGARGEALAAPTERVGRGRSKLAAGERRARTRVLPPGPQAGGRRGPGR